MECGFAEMAHRIDFEIPMDASDILEQIGFIVLLSMKFNGEIGEPSRYLGGDLKRKGSISVQLDDFTTWLDARTHCYNQLDGNGSVKDSYVGALERADPGLSTARSLLERLRAV